MIRWQRVIGEKARRHFGGSSSESGYDHFASALDNILYVAWEPRSHPGHPRGNPLVDGMLPIFPLVYNGIIMSQPYWATVDASYNRGKDKLKKLSDPKRRKGIHEMTEMTDYLWDPAHRVLKVWEYGGRPTFYFNDYETLAPMKEMYDAWQPMKHLVYEFIDRHDKLAESVYRTRWANGEEVVVNYSDDKPYDYRGRTVAPLGYEFYQKGTN